MDLIEFFQSGGFFMYPILVVFVLGLVIAIERFAVITATQNKTNRIWKQLTPMLKANDLPRAENLLKSQSTPLARVLQYGLAKLRSNASREAVEAAMEEGIMEVMPELEQRTHYLATLANIATLIGLLGTIIGLIQAFTAVASANPAEKADLLSASISVAMNTTAFGLTAAIPMILIHSFLATKTTRLVDNIEMATVKCLNLIVED
ncbi:MotA/TolQ/ExbB proton channel family protein [Saccharophagus sp. K07]|jgi:biopolymer transport protein ExbB|uniref:MotA/TolQ/ExbB proton channel family protein n=1 Tax=Saccharophagus sp. K07 TaxID=2283636 RepID=UPI001652A96E|nr:MotA/TolQ/ExbB proton channel family protein [Saccharophagus sp. K07]MBC6906053.1 MotA/TolQ/ExbB proton channel family protein [Saccharophagus sp. K07]